MGTFSGFVAEARRRRVFRTGGLYIVGAWALLQVADLALESLGLPGELLRYFWYAAFAGFPIALIFGWYYEITADGIRKTLPADSAAADALPMGVPDYVIIGALALVVAIGAAGLFDQARQAEELAGPYDPKAIAVLPLEDLTGGEDQEYFSAGMHDALIASLSRVSALRVVSRNSALRLDRSLPMQEIGKTLRVRNIIEGSVTREGNRVRVIIQLVDAARDTQIWAANFEREIKSVLSLQAEMARSIASAVNVQLTDDEESRLSIAETVDPDVYDKYLRGMYLLTQPNNRVRRRGIKILEALVDEGRADARVYAALAFGYAALGHSPYPEGMFEASKEAAHRAMALDDSIPEIYLALGMHALYYDWDFDVADAQLQRALELNPSLTATVYHYAWLMELWQYSDKALPLGDKTAELDPLSPFILFTLAEQYRNAKLYDEAIRIADEAIALNAQHAGAISTKGASIARQGDFETALAILEPVKDALPWGARYGAVLAMAGREQEARDYLDTIEKVPRNVLALVFIYSALGDNDDVFHWMNVARETKLPWYPWFITWFPFMDEVRQDPRMRELAAELGLTDALERSL